MDDSLYSSTFKMSDSLGKSGIVSTRRGYSWSQPDYGDFLIFEYEYVNESDNAYDNLFLGLYMDFDISSAQGTGYNANDLVGYDAALGLAYMYDSALPLNYIGIVGLDDDRDFGFHFWDWTQDPNTDAQFYDLLSDLAVQSVPPDSAWDYRVFVNTGPFSMAQGETLRVTYGVVAGADLESMQASAEGMRSLYETFGAKESPIGSIGTDLDFRLRPNPVSDFLYGSLSAETDCSIELFDASGRSTRRFGPFRETDLVLDLRDLVPGVYFLKLSAGEMQTFTRLLKIK